MQDFIDFCIDHFIIILIWMFLFISVIYVTVVCWCDNFFEISGHEVIRLINGTGSIIIDVRDNDHFYQGHIINSIHLSSSDIRLNCARELRRFITRSLIIVCSDGILSCSIARYLCKLGFKKIYVLKGGINAWNNESLPLVKSKGRVRV